VNTKSQMLCAWCGPAAIVLFMVGFWFIAGLVPPPSPHDTALQVVAIYHHHTNLKRLGLVVVMMAGAMTAPFVASISTQMKRIEGQYSPLSYTQLGLGMIGVLLFIIPAFMFEAALFRPDRAPSLVLALSDLAWLPFIGAFMPAFFQNLAIAASCFQDTEERVFPRWLGYFNVWVAIAFVPGILINFLHGGPFAWNGVFCFWLPLSVFGVWFFVMFWALRRGILAQAAEAVPAAAL